MHKSCLHAFHFIVKRTLSVDLTTQGTKTWEPNANLPIKLPKFSKVLSCFQSFYPCLMCQRASSSSSSLKSRWIPFSFSLDLPCEMSSATFVRRGMFSGVCLGEMPTRGRRSSTQCHLEEAAAAAFLQRDNRAIVLKLLSTFFLPDTMDYMAKESWGCQMNWWIDRGSKNGDCDR